LNAVPADSGNMILVEEERKTRIESVTAVAASNSTSGRIKLLTSLIFLDCIPDPDPFEKLDLILHFDPLPFSGLPIRSDLPIHFAFKGPKMFFLFALVNLFDRKRVTFKGNKSIGSKI
jgi:hypothetical protein